jgi:phenylacetate-CoA ligase
MMTQLAGDASARSLVRGIVWPAASDPAASRALALQFQLMQSERWPPDRLRAQQARQLARLVRHAEDSVPHYRGRLPRGLLRADGTVDEAYWADVPVLTREDVQQAGTGLMSGFVPPAHKPLTSSWSSGSTGRPIEIVHTAVTTLMWRAFTLRDHVWHRRDLSAKLAIMRIFKGEVGAPPAGTRRQGWGPATDFLSDVGTSVMLGIECDVGVQAEWLAREDPDYLLTFPSNARALAEHFEAHGMRLSRLREVRTVSEMLPADVREACRRAWNAPVTDLYSAAELGNIAFQCPSGDHYHVQSEGVLVEILDEAGQPCAPGQSGRVIVTGLHNFAMVLLRYEVGDYAEMGEPCACGRGLPVIRRILGRYRNMVVLPDGRTYWPRLGQDYIRKVSPVLQMQVVQRSLEEMEFRYTGERDLTPEEEADLTRVVSESVGHPFRLSFKRLPAIARSAGGKFEDFICEVPRGER